MAKKPAKKKAPAKAGVRGRVAKPESLLRILDANLRGTDRTRLFGAVAERVQTQLLTEDEAALIAGWFRELALGADPARVLIGETRGRKRGSNTTEYLQGRDVTLPDHVDLCWMIRRAVARTGDEDQIFRLVSERFGKTEPYIRSLYAKILPTLAPDPDL